MIDLDRILHWVSRPARYTGGEWNSIRKDWDSAEIRAVLAYPDAYEIGMSNMGMMILYDLLNKRPEFLVERVYAPWPDMENVMRNEGIPLFSLESRKPVREFDIVGFSLGYELTYTNVLNMLDLAGIPPFAFERSAVFPLVIAGGTCALNPEPMADFIDIFVIGDGEEVALELFEVIRQCKRAGSGDKHELLREVANVSGIYIPAFYQPKYDSKGRFVSLNSQVSESRAKIERRVVTKLPDPVVRLIVPYVEVTHDRGAVEIQRGCTRGCRFCQASVVYRPLRERPVEEVIHAIADIESNCGYEEISLLSLSTTDYSGIAELVANLSTEYRGKHLNISLPSLRPDAFSIELAQSIQEYRKTSLTFAPEAGTERLRRVINKNVSENDLLESIEIAMGYGWRNFKLYFMIGLPTETEEDVRGIVDLVWQARQIKSADGKRPNLKVNMSTFIPKPHTPFQWVSQCDEFEIKAKHELLRRDMRRTGSKLSWHNHRVSLLEGVMSRGDRKLGPVIQEAWQLGCRFDAWTDMLDFEKWMQAFEKHGLDPLNYLRERDSNEALPWGHIDTGISLDFLKGEYARAISGEETPDCRSGKCNACGLHHKEERCKWMYSGNSQ